MKYFTTLSKQAAYVIATIAVLFLTTVSFGQKGQVPQAGPTRPNLGTAATYAVFTGGGAINNTGLTKLTGDVGQDGAYAFNGFPPGTYTGTLNRNNGASALAKSDLLTAWTANAAVPCGFVLGVGIVDGQSFDPAVYCSGAATTTSGNITFDAHGDGTAIFIVKIGGQLDANSGTHILLANNAQAGNIYWFVDGAVNIADNSTFKGVIVSRGAIIFSGTSSLDGRALAAPLGAITLSSNSVGPFAAGSGNNLTVTRPAQGDTVKGGTTNYQITWTGSGIAPKKVFEYSLDSGKTFTKIGEVTGDVFTYNWNVPDTSSTKAIVRITDANALIGRSGVFILKSTKPLPGTIVVLRPAPAEVIDGKTQNYQITWTGSGIASQKTFSYSLDGGLTYTLIGTMTSDLFAFSWNVPDTASNSAMIRIIDANGAVGNSGIFIIKSTKPNPGSIIVTRPSAGETIPGGMQNYQITWTGSNISASKTFEYSIDSGATWNFIGVLTGDQMTYTWSSVPNVDTKKALVRITDGNGVTGTSGLFTITKNPGIGTIIVTHPVPNEVIAGGSPNFDIMWTGSNIAALKTFEYSLDGGATWNLIGVYNGDQFTYNWANVPNVATTHGLIRITDANGVTGTSGFFTITFTPGVGSINSITLSGLDLMRNIGNNKVLGISYTFTPDIGTSVEVEYSLDYTTTWGHIATLSTSEATSTSWTTPPTGYYNPVFIRVTSSKGMTRTSGPFSIGPQAGVAYTSQKDGYSLTNYPNPVIGETKISFVLPVANDVTLAISDALGREVTNIVSQHYDAGTHSVPFNASNLSGGMYNYTLRAGTTTLVGRMIIVK